MIVCLNGLNSINIGTLISTHTARVVLFSVMSVCVFVCLSVNMITLEPLEILSRNFQVERVDMFENGYHK